MAYVLIESGTPRFYSIAKLLDDNPSAVLSDPPTAGELAAYNVYELVVQPQPSYNRLTQKVVSAGIADVGGTWTLSWNVVDLTEEEIAARQTPEALAQLVAATQDSVAAVQESVAETAAAAASAGPAAYGWVQDRFVGSNNKVSGCTAALTSSGIFTITLDTPFPTADDYIVMTTGLNAHQYVIADQKSGSSFRIRVADASGNTVQAGFCQFVVHSLV